MFTKSLCIAAMTFSMAAPAHAAALRTFVSGFGSDSNTATNCSHAQPCRTFAMAYTVTSPGGEIEALDPAGYGPITIMGSVSLIGLPGAAINAPSGGNGITINAGPGDVVHVQGLLIDGSGVGYNGIVFNSGGQLTITNCLVQNFFANGNLAAGVIIQPTSSTVDFAITNTIVSNNLGFGIVYLPPSGAPSAHGVIDHVVATSDFDGIYVDTRNTTGGVTVTAISNSIASNNDADGILAENGPGTLKLSIDSADISGNGGSGIKATTTTQLLLGRSVITGNSIGVSNATASNTIYTYKDNRINLNGNDISSPLNTTLPVQ